MSLSQLESALEEARRRRRLVWLRLEAPFCRHQRAWDAAIGGTRAVRREAEEWIECRISALADPDLDAAVQQLLQAQGLAGGWPAQVFLLPSGRAVVGCVAPSEEALLRILRDLRAAYWLEKEALEAEALRVAASADPLRVEAPPQNLSFGREALEWLVAPALQSLDPETGLARSGSEAFLPASLYRALLGKKAGRSSLGATALERLARGPLADVIGGAFFRAPEITWPAVATEKLLGPNLLLYQALKESQADGALQAAGQLERALLEDFFSGQDFAPALSASPSFYALSAADLIEALPGPQRQAAQAFFQLTQMSPQLPQLPVEIPELAERLGKAPVDLHHELSDSLGRLRQHRRLKKEAPKALPAIGWLSDWAWAELAPIMKDIDKMREKIQGTSLSGSAEGPRERAARAQVLTRLSPLAARPAEALEGAQALLAPSLSSLRVAYPFSAERWLAQDHLGPSVWGLHLEALRKLASAYSRVDPLEARRLQDRLRDELGQALSLAKRWGLHAASVFGVAQAFVPEAPVLEAQV